MCDSLGEGYIAGYVCLTGWGRGYVRVYVTGFREGYVNP